MDKSKKIKFNILAVCLIILLAFAISPVTMQNDTYYTIKIGEEIIQNGIDMQDHFSWHENLPYTYPHWLYDVIIYLIYSFSGFAGIYISTVVFASILGILVYYINNKLSKNNFISLVITLLVLYLLKDFITARAQLVTFILFILTIFFIEMFTNTKKKKYLIPLVIIPILIANVHVAVWPFYFILFLPYIAEWFMSFVIELDILVRVKILIIILKERLTNKNEKITKLNEKKKKLLEELNEDKIKLQKRREKPYRIKLDKNMAIKWIVIIFIITIFTGLLTPLGDVPYTYLAKTMKGNTTQNISEHLPLVLINNKNVMIVITMFLAILILTDTKIRLKDLFMLIGLILLSFMSRRQTSMLILIGNFIFVKLVVQMINKYDNKTYKKIEDFMTGIFGQAISVILILCISLLLLKPKMNDKFVDENSYPVRACDFILENLDINNINVTLIPNILNIHTVQNTGGAFGVGEGNTGMFIITNLVVLGL
ncbi:MAG: signal peptidase II, partial [Clostridia bacterium]|nr:signal peptidase II [Clostridia bacterium]